MQAVSLLALSVIIHSKTLYSLKPNLLLRHWTTHKQARRTFNDSCCMQQAWL